VPEPGSVGLIARHLVALGVWRRRAAAIGAAAVLAMASPA
jgi:hypothetical protein